MNIWGLQKKRRFLTINIDKLEGSVSDLYSKISKTHSPSKKSQLKHTAQVIEKNLENMIRNRMHLRHEIQQKKIDALKLKKKRIKGVRR